VVWTKAEIVLIFLIFLLVFYLIFRSELPFQYSAAMIALIGFNPFFWDFKDKVVSDIPFTLFVYFSLSLIHQAYQSGKLPKSQLRYAILVGLFIYLSYGTRSIGIVLIPSLLIYDIVRSRRPTRFSVTVTFLFVLFMMSQTIFLHSDGSYFDQFAINLKVILHNLFWYATRLSILWDNGHSRVIHGALYIIVCGLATIGYLARIRDRITIFEIFLLSYTIPVIIWPSRSLRLLIPVMPLYIFYAFVGIKGIFDSQRKEIEKSAFAIFTVVILVSYVVKFTKVDYGPIDEGVGKKETVELFDYIIGNTEEGDVFIFRKPRVLSLFTGRSASVCHQPNDGESLWDYFHKIGATHLITGPSDPAFLELFVEEYEDDFDLVYQNSDFTVYRLLLMESQRRAANTGAVAAPTAPPASLERNLSWRF
jgi:hypothetical protein